MTAASGGIHTINGSTTPLSQPLLHDLRILLLEDESLIAMDVEQLCRDHGARLVDAIARLAQIGQEDLAARYDAAIVDLMLAGQSTLDFAAQLKRQNIPFIVASGYASAQEVNLLLPGTLVVEKPYSGDDLVEALGAACGRFRSPQAAEDPVT